MIYIEDTETEIKKLNEPSLLVTSAKLNLSATFSTTRATDLKASQVNYHVNFRFDLVWISKNIRYLPFHRSSCSEYTI